MLACAAVVLVSVPAMAQQKPNILVIWGDDIGTTNISLQQPRTDGLQDAQH